MRKRRWFDMVSMRLPELIGSRWFWRVSMGLFVLQAAYIAASGLYSMAFDEYYHFGIIQAYSKVWLPWQVQQPPGPAELGAVTTDASYLFHYLMSFPYRVTELLTSSHMAQIITLRLLDVMIVAIGFIIYQRLLRKIGVSNAATNIILAVVMLLPVTPWLAGQLTYDTLFFTMSGLVLLTSVRLVQIIRGKHRLPVSQVALVLALLALAAQIKYAFLPMALAIGGYIIALLVVETKKRRLDLRGQLSDWRKQISTGPALMAVGLLLLSTVFFMQRYGVNTAQYGTPLPDCSAVLSLDVCRDYDPYGRNQNYIDSGFYRDITTQKLLTYPFNWLTQMMRELYFTVGPRDIGYPGGKPLPVSYVTGYVIATSTLSIIVIGFTSLLRRGSDTQLLLLVVGVYITALFWQNLGDYRATGVPVAIHGRYILQLLPIFGALAYLALPRALQYLRTSSRAVAITAAVLFLLTFYGGGDAPFIIRSSDAWYWDYAVPTSRVVRSALWHVVIR